MTETNNIKSEIAARIVAAADLKSLDDIRVAALGKKGSISELMKALGEMSPEERKTAGPALNALKNEVSALIESRQKALEQKALDVRLSQETIDVTLPARATRKGSIHPISQTIEELVSIFGAMGFTVAEGPDIEDDWHNFTALNFPVGHPAREMQDTFFLPDAPEEKGECAKKLLRTHTSPVQIRYMTNNKPPFKIICFGRTYRSDWDMTHTPMFHQMECLYVDKDVHMGHLKGCLSDFVSAFFGVPDLPVRFRPSFFPFVEPGAEVDIGCSRKDGGLKIGAGGDWLEIGGSGMVHENVLKNCGIDPGEYQGFAFGMGIERMAMLKYGIPDLRTFFESDVRWLAHYGFSPLDRPNTASLK